MLQGQFGRGFKIDDTFIKYVDILNEKEYERMVRNVEIINKLIQKTHSVNFTECYSHILDKQSCHHKFPIIRKNAKYCGEFVFEYGGMCMNDIDIKPKREFYDICLQILSAIQLMRENKVSHGDLHHKNICLLMPSNNESKYVAKIVDYDLIHYEKDETLDSDLINFFFDVIPFESQTDYENIMNNLIKKNSTSYPQLMKTFNDLDKNDKTRYMYLRLAMRFYGKEKITKTIGLKWIKPKVPNEILEWVILHPFRNESLEPLIQMFEKIL